MREGKWEMEVVSNGEAQPEHSVDSRTVVEALPGSSSACASVPAASCTWWCCWTASKECEVPRRSASLTSYPQSQIR